MSTEPIEVEVPDAAAVAAADAKVETALATVSKEKSPIKVAAHDIAFESAAELYRMAQAFVQGGVAPRGAVAGGVMAAILKGRELGIGTITAVTSIVVVNGRTQVAGALILALLKKNGIRYTFDYEGEGNGRLAWIQAWEPARGEKQGAWKRHEFSWGDAIRAGLTNKKGDVWKAYPDDMILWRAVSKMGRRQFPELCAGIYVHGEAPGDPQPDIESETAAPEPTPPASPDPLLAVLAKAAKVEAAEEAVPVVDIGYEPDPEKPADGAPFASHADADAAIAAEEKKESEARPACAHASIQKALARTKSGKALDCPECGEWIKPSLVLS